MRLIDADAYAYPGDLVNEPTIEAIPKWISVKDALPEFKRYGMSDVVLAYSPTHGKCLAMMYDRGDGGHWFCHGVEQETITHWMPLPEPPKED